MNPFEPGFAACFVVVIRGNLAFQSKSLVLFVFLQDVIPLDTRKHPGHDNVASMLLYDILSNLKKSTYVAPNDAKLLST